MASKLAEVLNTANDEARKIQGMTNDNQVFNTLLGRNYTQCLEYPNRGDLDRDRHTVNMLQNGDVQQTACTNASIDYKTAIEAKIDKATEIVADFYHMRENSRTRDNKKLFCPKEHELTSKITVQEYESKVEPEKIDALNYGDAVAGRASKHLSPDLGKKDKLAIFNSVHERAKVEKKKDWVSRNILQNKTIKVSLYCATYGASYQMIHKYIPEDLEYVGGGLLGCAVYYAGNGLSIINDRLHSHPDNTTKLASIKDQVTVATDRAKMECRKEFDQKHPSDLLDIMDQINRVFTQAKDHLKNQHPAITQQSTLGGTTLKNFIREINDNNDNHQLNDKEEQKEDYPNENHQNALQNQQREALNQQDKRKMNQVLDQPNANKEERDHAESGDESVILGDDYSKKDKVD